MNSCSARGSALRHVYEVAEMLSVSPETVLEMTASGYLPIPGIHGGRCHWREAGVSAVAKGGEWHSFEPNGPDSKSRKARIQCLRNLIYEFQELSVDEENMRSVDG